MSDRSKRKNFAFYGIFQEMLRSLPDEARLKMYDAIIDYGIGRTPPSFQGDKHQVLEESLWKFFKEKLDLSHKRYEASLKGGAPKGNSNGKKHNGKESGSSEDNQIQPNSTKFNQGTTIQSYENRNAQQKELELQLGKYSQKFRDTWACLLGQHYWQKKSPTSMLMCLKELNGFDEEFSIKLMERAIAKDYKGIVYASDYEDYKKWQKAKDNHPEIDAGKPVNADDFMT